MGTVLGYNLVVKVKDGATEKLMAGITSNKFAITPTVKESLTKNDKGTPSRKTTGYSWELEGSGFVSINGTGETSQIDRNDLIRMTKAGTAVEVMYGNIKSGNVVQKGTAIITGYDEDSPADDEATFSISLGGSGDLTDYTVPTED